MMFAVLNPGGRDCDQLFCDGLGNPGAPGHAPVNFHAYAACLGGGFFRDERQVMEGVVLLLVRKRNLRQVLSSIGRLRQRGIKVLVSCKETGAHQVADLLGDVSRWELFQEICSEADTVLTPVSALEPLYRAAGAKRVECVPTPYPVEFSDWDFGVPLNKRRGIFVGTREFGVPSRNHLAAIAMADGLSRELACPIAVVNSEGRRGGMLLKTFQRKNPLFYLLEGPLSYPDYLEVMALHRIVWQLDASSVLGQVAADALLCRMPCLGGNSEIEKIAFPEFYGAPIDHLVEQAKRLLSDDAEWVQATEDASRHAVEKLSFDAVSKRLLDVFASLE